MSWDIYLYFAASPPEFLKVRKRRDWCRPERKRRTPASAIDCERPGIYKSGACASEGLKGMQLEELRALIVTHLLDQWPEKAAAIVALRSEDDLLGSGIVDSYGFVEMCLAVEERTGAVIDIAELEPEQYSSISALHKVVMARSSSRSAAAAR